MNLKITGILGACALALFFLAPPVLAAAPESHIVNTECWFAPPDGVRAICGWLQTPEDRTNPDNDRVVRMPVVILEGSAGMNYGPYAVVLGGGGPGGGLGLDSAEDAVYWENYRRDALGDAVNLVLMDQRGAGMSKPLLACPDSKISGEEYLSEALTLKDDIRILRKESEECANQFADWGIDLSAYTTAASADDFEDLRRLLLQGGQRWDIIGMSYGTRLAFELLRRHPDGVGGVVMQGIDPPEASALRPYNPSASALVKIADACNKDDFCRTNYGDLRINLESAASRLEQAPITVLALSNYGKVTVAVNSTRLADIIFSGMYDEVGVALIPCVVWELSGGQECRFVMNGQEWSGLEWLASLYADITFEDGYADALLYAIACRERGKAQPDNNAKGYPFALWSESNKHLDSICDDIWAKEGRTQEAQAPVATKNPILMLTGFFDPATPPEWADAAAARLPNARVYQLPGAHGGERQRECENGLTRQFIAAPFSEINDFCVRAAEPIPFY